MKGWLGGGVVGHERNSELRTAAMDGLAESMDGMANGASLTHTDGTNRGARGSTVSD